MTLAFPEAWSAVRFPYARAELLECLRESSKSDLYRDRFEVEALVHFLYDDHDLAPDPRKEIGTILFDDAEALALQRFVDLLDVAIGPGTKLTSIAVEKRNALAHAAADVLTELAKRGMPTFVG